MSKLRMLNVLFVLLFICGLTIGFIKSDCFFILIAIVGFVGASVTRLIRFLYRD